MSVGKPVSDSADPHALIRREAAAWFSSSLRLAANDARSGAREIFARCVLGQPEGALGDQWGAGVPL